MSTIAGVMEAEGAGEQYVGFAVTAQWLASQCPKFQGLVLASCGMFTQSLVKIGLLPFPVEH